MVHSKQTCSINPRTSTTTSYQAVAIHVTVPEIFRTVKRCAFDAFAPLKSIFDSRTKELSQHLLNRQYFRGTIENAIKKAKSKPRTETLTYKTRQTSSKRVPLVTEFHPGLPPLANIIQKNFHLLQGTERLKSVFPELPVIAFKRPSNLRDIIVRASFRDDTPLGESTTETTGSSPCTHKIAKRAYLSIRPRPFRATKQNALSKFGTKLTAYPKMSFTSSTAYL
ncbi:hypothetical protein BSL78_27143 [Apostichopus japonicus]|uniref:Uncharacterized protein n=1 Tax=Stichopus japonicus TaxID=307972 RepID=A0A2G8JJU7_STIJA|nr:hypothetical protein BSL78_27143 [Apostichopus japonicus]